MSSGGDKALPRFRSDNNAGVSPQILRALAAVNTGNAGSYGEDAETRALTARLSALFEHQLTCVPVGTGIAANALALSAVTAPGQIILTHRNSHILTKEDGAVQLLSGGADLVAVQEMLLEFFERIG